MSAMPSRSEPNDHPADHRRVQFTSEAAFRAWARENVAEGEEFADNCLASSEEFRAWRAAGKPGFPPGWISHRDYMQQRDL